MAKRRGTFTRRERMEKEKRRGMEREEERELSDRQARGCWSLSLVVLSGG
jgi:hypothetical protein